MKRIYISSTREDLHEYRNAVIQALRKIGHHVVGMEGSTAKDQRTVARCRADVAGCDVYVGLAAWRYGSIPRGDDNPDRKSFTELEYEEAEARKTCLRLLFVLDDSVPWLPHMMDTFTRQNGAGKRIREFRERLRDHSAALFRSPENLALQVMEAIYYSESTKRIEQIALFDEIKSTTALGRSGLPNIQEKIIQAKQAEVVQINLGTGESWWSTRLHLVAALATDFTAIDQLVFTDAAGGFLGMYSPAEVRRAMASRFPQIETAYVCSAYPSPPPPPVQDPAAPVFRAVANWSAQMARLLPHSDEAGVKHWVTADSFAQWMAGRPGAERVEMTGQSQTLLQHQIVTCRSPFVAVVERGRLKQVADRAAVASRIARLVLQESLQ